MIIKQWIYYFILLVGSCFLTSCHYQLGQGDLSTCYRTISVPYVEGDQNGDLTSEIIKKLSVAGAFSYVNTGGDLLLKVRFIESSNENIGFRYDRKRDGKRKRSIIPTETRMIGLVEVTVKEAQTGKIIRGPTNISASFDFDHTYYSTRHEINIFSLGQLNDIDAAKDAAQHPLNCCLAERIVDYVINSW